MIHGGVPVSKATSARACTKYILSHALLSEI
jgi:hypothetical protein